MNIGDIVIVNSLVQRDMDARPIMKQFEIPLLGISSLYLSKYLFDSVYSKIKVLVENNFLINTISAENQKTFSILNPKLFVGQIASGYQFFVNSDEKKRLLLALPEVLCVEMEGAAVAQVCYEYDIQYVIIRTISDVSNEGSPVGFKKFVERVASKYGLEIIRILLV
ncbi:phosphorylase family protein [Flavobacterium cellulosilyticum]|uniref:phosphorylase family protein n=1 Tax=Flavobacterium cellulosilyticum TaxID=2541731 RepID=UPI001FEC689E|nr:hypothetical protein [Flavobacterium cellulosilyticum]